MSYDDLCDTLKEYNWDDGFETLERLLNNPQCDLALALKIFYLADGFACLDGDAENTHLQDWKQFISDLYKEILNGKYKKTDNTYKVPLTRAQKYKFAKKAVPDIFLLDL